MIDYLVVHGSFGSPFSNWFNWFYQEMSKEGKQVLIPQFPIGLDYQNYNNWSKLLDYYRNLNIINEKTTFIGHSIGSIFIIKYLIENNMKQNKIILVSAFNNYIVDGGDYDKVNATFFVKDISSIKLLVKDIICIYGNNDPYVKLEELSRFAQEIATKKIVIPNGGHLNSEFGYNTFEKILEEI